MKHPMTLPQTPPGLNHCSPGSSLSHRERVGVRGSCKLAMQTIAVLISAISTDITLATAENNRHYIRIISGE